MDSSNSTSPRENGPSADARTFDHADPTAEFRQAMLDAGLSPPEHIEPGKLYRFPSGGKTNGDAARCRLFQDGLGGWFQDFALDIKGTWQAHRSTPYTAQEREAFKRKCEADRRIREADEAKKHADAAKKAAALWKAGKPASADHPYLVRKQLSPVDSLRELGAEHVKKLLAYSPQSRGVDLTGRILLAPVKMGGKKLSTLELIDEAGRKSALAGGAKRGGYWAAQALPEGQGDGLTLCIGEGVATVLSAHEATGYPVVAALSSGNLPPVALSLRKRYAKATLVLLADLVKETGTPDPHAEEAAQAVGGVVAIPDFGDNRPQGATDFNDLAVLRGKGAVMRLIEKTLAAFTSDAPCESRCEDAQALGENAFTRAHPFRREIYALSLLSPVEYDQVRTAKAKELGIRARTLDAEMTRERKRAAKAMAEARTTNDYPTNAPLPGHEDLISLVKTAFGNLGYGGDSKIPLLIYLCATTRLLAFNAGNMLSHCQVTGPAASGKNYTIDCVLALMPDGSYLKIDAGSPKALIYSAEDVRHKIVVFTEADSLPTTESGSKSLADGDSRATAASALRNLASDGQLVYDVVERDPETGAFVTRRINKPGPTLLMTTTTKAITGQMGTRLWEIPVKETDGQIQAALEKRASFELDRIRHIPEELVRHQAYLQGRAPWDVIVPFAKELVGELFYKGADPRIQRDYQRLLALIKAVTVLRHAKRAQDGNNRWIATVEDYEAVYDVLNESYSTTVNDGLTEEVRAVVGVVGKLTIPVTYSAVAGSLGWHPNKARRHAQTAMRHGWLVNTQEKRKQPAELAIGDPMPDKRGLPNPKKMCAPITGRKECESVKVNSPNGSSDTQCFHTPPQGVNIPADDADDSHPTQESWNVSDSKAREPAPDNDCDAVSDKKGVSREKEKVFTSAPDKGCPIVPVQKWGLQEKEPTTVTCITCAHYQFTTTCVVGFTTSNPNIPRQCGRYERDPGADDDRDERKAPIEGESLPAGEEG